MTVAPLLPAAKLCSRPRCARAGELQPREAFREDPRSRDGLQTACRECERSAMREARMRMRRPCVRCLVGRRLPYSKLCSVCTPTAVEDCQARRCEGRALPGLRWCADHRPGSTSTF